MALRPNSKRKGRPRKVALESTKTLSFRFFLYFFRSITTPGSRVALWCVATRICFSAFFLQLLEKFIHLVDRFRGHALVNLDLECS